ncbi:MAG TPA: NAD(P)-binding domain-containing protein [Polyangiales bacterium]|nr:NAD(P)-binding domain-containing protein [Polyangiales bacterium]
MTSVALVGTGRMGSALGRAQLRAGHTLVVWNRTPAKATAIEGARVAESVVELAQSAEVVLVNVLDYAASDGLLRTREVVEALRGKLLVQLTSGSPAQAREADAWARAQELAYLDGAIMATPEYIGQPGCTLLYGGARASLERARPVLAALGDVHFVGENAGQASALDAALLTGMWGRLFGVLQGALLSEVEQIPLDVYRSFSDALTPMVEGAAGDLIARVAERRWGAETPASLETHHGALLHALAICREHGLNDAVLRAFQELFERGLRSDLAQRDFAELARVMR